MDAGDRDPLISPPGESWASPARSGIVVHGMTRTPELKSLKRGMQALVHLAAHRSLTISQAARLLDLPRTTAERVMLTLEGEGFIARLPDSKRFALAPRILAVAAGYSAEDHLIDSAAPLLFAMTREIGWPLAVATAVGDRMSVRLTTDASTSLGLHKRHVGSEIPMAMASSGVMHLACLDPPEREQRIALLAAAVDPVQPLARDRPRLDALIGEASRLGYSIDPASGPERALSVPLREGGRIRAVLLMMYMVRGVSHETLIAHRLPQLQALAAAIEEQAFGPQPPA